ncbi:hypothetical protein D9M70_519980 [compost metagenome]
MHEIGRGAGRCQGRSDLAADMAALADAGDDDTPLALADQLDCIDDTAGKSFVGAKVVSQRLDADHCSRQRPADRLQSRNRGALMRRCLSQTHDDPDLTKT